MDRSPAERSIRGRSSRLCYRIQIALFALAGALFAISVEPVGAAETRLGIQSKHRGFTLGAVHPRSDATFDVQPLPAAEGLARIARALDLLYDRSPLSAKALETLKQAGEVVIAYDPHFPKSQLSSLTIAAFFPDYFQHDGARKQFVTVVGRYGAKWPPAELAAVIAHELVGHGMQHYRGRLDHLRTIDLECEAYLYEEQAYQDLGMDKRLHDMIRFRQALEDNWCKSFRAYLQRRAPARIANWERLNPAVPRILDDFLAYVEELRRTGEAKRAIDIERRDGIRR